MILLVFLDVVYLLPQSTAAAIMYNLTIKDVPERIFMVFNMGANTLSILVFRKKNGNFLGGESIIECLLKQIIEYAEREWNLKLIKKQKFRD